jgi:large-conductance mechanosensitive channel
MCVSFHSKEEYPTKVKGVDLAVNFVMAAALGSPVVSAVAERLRPRYHFSGNESMW